MTLFAKPELQVKSILTERWFSKNKVYVLIYTNARRRYVVVQF